jgi:hypothetical protein
VAGVPASAQETGRDQPRPYAWRSRATEK